MVYKVIRVFQDLTDPDKHTYVVGDTYPRDGYKPTEEFTKGLLTGSNSTGSIFLAVDENAEEESDTDEVPETAEEEAPAEEEDEATEEVPTEKPKHKRTPKKAEA